MCADCLRRASTARATLRRTGKRSVGRSSPGWASGRAAAVHASTSSQASSKPWSTETTSPSHGGRSDVEWLVGQFKLRYEIKHQTMAPGAD